MSYRTSLTLPPRNAALEEQLFHAFKNLPFGMPSYAYDVLPSTMNAAHQAALNGVAEGTCIWAETQTAGRGRAGRQWSSPPGGIYLSVILHPTRPLNEVPQLALLAGLAAAQAIYDLTGLSGSIRWPNDVLVDGKKVVGILAESSRIIGESPVRYAIVGIGINVSTPPTDLPEGAGSLRQWIQPAPNRFSVAAAWFRHLSSLYVQWNAKGFSAVRPELSRWIGLFGKMVTIKAGKQTYEGQAADIDDDGRLLVRLDSGIVKPFDAGDVTLLR